MIKLARKKNIKYLYIIAITLMIIISSLFSTPNNLRNANYLNTNIMNDEIDKLNYNNNQNNKLTNSKNTGLFPISNDVRPEENSKIGEYQPIQHVSGNGNNFSVQDNLNVHHSASVDIKENTSDTGYNFVGNYSISNIDGYSASDMTYNITEITATVDYYPIEKQGNGKDTLSNDEYEAMAQAFEVKWDYAKFYGAKMFLTYDGGFSDSLGSYELELFLVNASTDSDQHPNMTDILSNCTSNPFKQGSTYSDTGMQFFDFQDVILPKGLYYIVANLSVIDTAETDKHFQWERYKYGDDGGKTWIRNAGSSIWNKKDSINSYDYTLEPYLLPSNSTGAALSFNDPKQINLEDNGTSINSYNDHISGIGTHYLSSNTSVSLKFNNSYNFIKVYPVTEINSTFIASNSSFNAYDINWNITWSSDSFDYSSYNSLNRTQLVITPSDWSSTFSFYYNETNSISGTRTEDGYLMYLLSNNSAANWRLSTSSPNHIYSLNLYNESTETDRYFLGYWTTDGSKAYGHSGSTITFHTLIRGNNGSIYNDSNGVVNITLFDSSGNIVPFKGNMTVINSSFIFNDNTNYTKANIPLSSSGLCIDNLTFDPSNNTDKAGFWTALVLWHNGTETGIYSQRIVVQTRTAFHAEWETTPGSGVWTTSDISRKSGDTINIRATYYNISEPFFSGSGNDIPHAYVNYSVSWGDNGSFNNHHPEYNQTILVTKGVGTYSVNIVASGAFIENASLSFSFDVFYESKITPVNSEFTTNYSRDAIFKFAFLNVTGSNSEMFPDDLQVSANGSSVNPSSFIYINDSGKVKLTINTSKASLDVGYWQIVVSAYKENFRESYLTQNATYTFDLTITAIPTKIIIDRADTEVYVYYNASIDFRYRDLNYSTNITGASYTLHANITNVSFDVIETSCGYHINIINNNYTSPAISIYLTISKRGYISQSNYLLAIITIKHNPTQADTVTTPSEVYLGYNSSMIISYNDSAHNTTIEGATVLSVNANTSTAIDWAFTDLGNGQYNISFVYYDASASALKIDILIGKDGYIEAIISITIQTKEIPTHYEEVSTIPTTIIYLEEGRFAIYYWDNISDIKILDADVTFSGSLISAATISLEKYSNGTYMITISQLKDFGTFSLTLLINKDGYMSQELRVELTLLRRSTTIASTSSTEQDIYAVNTLNVFLEYKDQISNTTIEADSYNISFDPSSSNASLSLSYYFDSIAFNGYAGTLHLFVFDPNAATASNKTFVIDITLSKFGYSNRTITLTLHVKIVPTSTVASDEHLTVVSTEHGIFDIYYIDEVNSLNISGASISITQLNGSTDDILNAIAYSLSNRYVVDIRPNPYTSINKTFTFNVTLFMPGYENQTITIQLSVIAEHVSFDLKITMNDTTLHRLSEVLFFVKLTPQDIQALMGGDIPFLYSPIGDNVTVTLYMLDAQGNVIQTNVFNVTITEAKSNEYTGSFSFEVKDWNTKAIRLNANYIAGKQVVVSITKHVETFEVAFPYFSDLFFTYIVYMITTMSLIAALFIGLTIYFAAIRPKKLSKQYKRKKYVDSVSNILLSVMSIKKVLVVHRETGAPVYDLDLGSQMRVSSELVTGFLQAVSTMASEITGKSRYSVKKLDYGDFIVSSVGDENYVIYVFSDRELCNELLEGLSKFSKFFGERFKHVAENWTGLIEEFTNNEKIILRNISENLYIWTLYPLATNPTKANEIKKLAIKQQKIYKFVKEAKDATIGLILEYFNTWPKNETIALIFYLVEKHFLLTRRI